MRLRLVHGRSIAILIPWCGSALALAMSAITSQPTEDHPQRSSRSTAGMVAASTPSATRAAVSVLERGGNAIDAAAAAHFALMVTDPANTSLGGRVQILIARRGGALIGIDGATQAPAQVPPLSAGSAVRTGYAVAPVPGAPAALAMMVERYGRLTLADVMQPAIDLARRGFAVTPGLAANWSRAREALHRDEGAARHFLRPDLAPFAAGEIFRQESLAGVLDQIARGGVAAFYRGPIAEAVAQDMRAKGGFVSSGNLHAYRPLPAPIVRTTYRGFEIAALGGRAWGDTLVEMLNILEEFPPRSDASLREAEILARTMGQALADRPQELGTLKPKPGGYALSTLSSRGFARTRAAAIRAALAAGTVPSHRDVRREWHETTHLSVMDAEGNAVALTTSIGPSFGAGVASPELGFLYGHSYRMRAEPRAGARDETEMTPTIVLRGSRPVLAIGAAGSERIPTAILQVVHHLVDRGTPLEQAVALPRFFSFGRSVRVEVGIDPALVEGLRARGFEVEVTDAPLGTVHAVQLLDETREYVGVADPRYDGAAAGPPPRGRPRPAGRVEWCGRGESDSRCLASGSQ